VYVVSLIWMSLRAFHAGSCVVALPHRVLAGSYRLKVVGVAASAVVAVRPSGT
jgi:hypothetical protein